MATPATNDPYISDDLKKKGVRSVVGSSPPTGSPLVNGAIYDVNNLNAAGADLLDTLPAAANKGLRYVFGSGVPAYDRNIRRGAESLGFVNPALLDPDMRLPGPPPEPPSEPPPVYTNGAETAGPPRPDVRFVDPGRPIGPTDTPMSPIDFDRGAPLPAGVKRHVLTQAGKGPPEILPGVYEGERGKYGERTFSDNPFWLRQYAGHTLSPREEAAMGAITAATKKRIVAEDAAAQKAAFAARIAPQSAKEYGDLLLAVAKAAGINDTNAFNREQHKQTLTKGAYGLDSADPFSQLSADVTKAAAANNVPYEEAVQRGNIAAANAALASGMDPEAPNAPTSERGGAAAIKQKLAKLLARGQKTITTGQFHEAIPFYAPGRVVDPAATSAGSYELSTDFLGNPVLTGPPDNKGTRHAVFVSQQDAVQLAPYITGMRGLRRDQAPPISDRDYLHQ